MHCVAEATEAALDIAAAPRDAVLDLLQRVPGSSVNDQKVLEQMYFIPVAHAYPIGRSQSFVYFETDSFLAIPRDMRRFIKDNKHWENIGFFRKREGEWDGEGVVMVFAPINSPGEFNDSESFKGPINLLPWRPVFVGGDPAFVSGAFGEGIPRGWRRHHPVWSGAIQACGACPGPRPRAPKTPIESTAMRPGRNPACSWSCPNRDLPWSGHQ